MLQQPAALVVMGVLAPFQGHYLYLSIRVRIQLFLPVSAFSIEFLSIEQEGPDSDARVGGIALFCLSFPMAPHLAVKAH